MSRGSLDAAGARARARALLRAALLVLLIVSCRPGADARRAAPAGESAGEPAADSASALDPFMSYRRALSLGEQQRFTESLVHFRRALAETTDAWQPHCDYAITLFHAALEPRLARHGERPWVRSSFERCELLRESAHELDVAERLSPTAEAKGYVIARRARQLAAWQLGWDAISEFTRAGAAVPRHQEQAAALLEAMRDPARSSTGEIPVP